MKNIILLFISAVLGTAFLPPVVSAESPKEITVAAASDLYNAFGEIGRMFEGETGIKVVFSFGSTGNLTTQIRGGAPFDVFASADMSYIEQLKRNSLVIEDSVKLYARGRIVLASNIGRRVKIKSLSDLLDPAVRKIAIANPGHAPYGRAAKQALQRAGIWDRIRTKLVYGENVRQALIYVSKGEAEAGVIALSVANSPGIEYVLIDEKMHEPLNQALAVIGSTKKERLAREFIAYVMTKGRPVMKKYGFLVSGEFPD